MISTGMQERNGELEEYLQLLHSMAFEIERAMSAISANSVAALEDSLANQEVFSTRLLELADDFNKPLDRNVWSGRRVSITAFRNRLLLHLTRCRS